jgi:cytochrome c553
MSTRIIMTRACLLTALAAAGIATATAPTQQAAAGKAAFGVCEACHGAQAQGNRSLNAPRIAGLEDC